MIKIEECSFSELENFLKRGKYYTYSQLFESGQEEKVMFRFLSIFPTHSKNNDYELYHSNSRLKLTKNNFKFCTKINRVDSFYVFSDSTFGFSSRVRNSFICEIFRYKIEIKRNQGK